MKIFSFQLIFATVLAVGLAEEAKAVVAPAPYLYGYPGYGAAPLAYNYAPVAYNNAPYTYATTPVVAAAPAPIPQTYAPAFAPVPAPAVSSQFAAQVRNLNNIFCFIRFLALIMILYMESWLNQG